MFSTCSRPTWSDPPPRDPPHSLHLNHHNYCAIISRALISSQQGGYMVHAARASVNRATARFILRPARRRRDGSAASKGSSATPPSPNQSLAKHNRKPTQLTENNHQRPKSIASFCRNLSAPPPHPTNHDSRGTYHAFLISSRPGLEIEL